MDARESIFRDVNLWLANDYGAYTEITARIEALHSYDVCEAGTDGHEGCDYDEPCVTMDDWPSFEQVGEIITDWLSEMIEEHVSNSFVAGLLRDLLDLGDQRLTEMHGERWYPDDARIRLDQAGRTPR